tara:strand:+ start:59 stop:670 length:612 start_codon:yes stop_codon:yes gene_type:complete
MSTIITSSNGFKLRLATLADKDTIIQAYDNFPQPLVQTYQDALDKFSLGHYLNKGYNETAVKDNNAPLGRMEVLENSDEVIVSISILNYNRLAPKSYEASWTVVPVEHRGNKYNTAHLMVSGYYNFTVLDMDYVYWDLIQTDTQINNVDTHWKSKNGAVSTAEIAKTGVGTGASLKTQRILAAEYEAVRAAHSTWKSVTYTTS